jgi:hypothetical protein
MAHDESQHKGDGHSQTDASPDEPLAPMTIDTADPAIDSAGEHPSDWKLQPDATTRLETTQAGEPDLHRVSGVRTVVSEPDPRHGEDRGRDQEDRGEDRSRRERQQRPSMIKNLLITASVALVCGVIGAMGYAHFFGPKSKGSSPDQSQGKSDSGSKNEPGPKEKSGGGESKQSNAQASTTSSIPGVSPAKDADMDKQQIKDLSQRVDQLRARVDDLTRPTDATPPAMRTMQIKMSDLAREMADIAMLPAAYRQYDNRLENLKEEIKTLRACIEAARSDPIGGGIPSLTSRAGIAAPIASPNAAKDPSGGP